MPSSIVFLFALIGWFASAHADEITIRADIWYPHNGDPKSDSPGYMIDIAKEVFTAKGMTINYDAMPWERALAQTREGKVNCVVGAASSDAPDFIFPTESQGHNQNYFYVKKGHPWRYTALASLETIKLGVIDGYSYDDAIDKYIQDNKNTARIQSIGGATPLEQNVKKLLAGRIDALVESGPVLQSKLAQMRLEDQVETAGVAGAPAELFIACSPRQPKSAELTRSLSEGMIQLRSSGKLQAILAKYGLKDWK